ncbi:MAG: hypothetical protein SFU87_21085 [Chitinophagaceae bacterium]|nr:hypothetical protein [Chitinophagaceae bacterium]
MKYLLIIFITSLLIFSCSKDKFNSKPGLTLKSLSSTFIPAGGGLEVTMRLTDLEGDIGDTIWIRKLTTRCANSNFTDSGSYRIPSDIPRIKNLDGDLVLTFPYSGWLQPQCTRADTAVFSFWVKDQKKNVSDTVVTPAIIIERQ